MPQTETISLYMGLSLPIPSVTQGPQWAIDFVAAFTRIDSHTHVSGQGQQIPTAGLNINADLTFNSFNAILLRTVRFVSNSAPPSLLTDANALAVSGGNLYFLNGSGQAVQITSGSAISATSIGGISGLASPASCTYTASAGSFAFQSGSSRAAALDIGPLTIRDTTVSAGGISIVSPSPIVGAYSITLPASLPASNALLSLSAAGVLSAFGTVSASQLALADKLTINGTAALPTLQLNSAGSPQRGAIAFAGQATPSSPSDGDGWYDTTLSPARFSARLNGKTANSPTALAPDTNIGSTYSPAYWIDANGVVELKGLLTNSTGGAVSSLVTTNPLPAGFRPASGTVRMFPCYNSAASATFAVQVNGTNGQITVPATIPNGTAIFLDSIRYLAES